MASSGSGYDLSNTTFSPDGRIFQVEYAQKAVDSSGTIIGLHCSDGIVIGVEKVKGSKMLVEGSGRRVHTVGKGMGLGVTGFVSDGRQIGEFSPLHDNNTPPHHTTPLTIPPPSILLLSLLRPHVYIHIQLIVPAMKLCPITTPTVALSLLRSSPTVWASIYINSPFTVATVRWGWFLSLPQETRIPEIWASIRSMLHAPSSNTLAVLPERGGREPRLRSRR